ncbi:MAG: putative arginine biosynthesis protein ArgJ, partial [bacterium]
SLLWNNRNDLDLHIVTPAGYHIYYGDKRAPCGGWLDVDMNVSGETTKPVENIRWKKGDAKKGRYQVYVQNYRFHERSQAPTHFKVELEINGEVKHFEGQTLAGKFGSESNVDVYEFTYDPNLRPIGAGEEDKYAGYDDATIKRQWANVIPPENILLIDDPQGIVDVMLGALALVEGTSDLDTYLVDMQGRGQTEIRQGQTRKALEGLATSASATALTKIEASGLPSKDLGKKRGGKSKRL